MSEIRPTPRTTLRRRPARGSHERATIEAILDEAFVGHLAWQSEGGPCCIPMVYARRGDALYLHGARGNRALRALRDGRTACLCVTILDGLVFSRSAFHSSVNYRSVVVYAPAREVTDAEEKREALRHIVESAMPGRFVEVRAPSEKEVEQVLVLCLPLAEASAKVRTGPPVEEEADYARPGWAGVLPLALRAGTPIDDPRLPPGVPPPGCVLRYARPGATSTSDRG